MKKACFFSVALVLLCVILLAFFIYIGGYYAIEGFFFLIGEMVV